MNRIEMPGSLAPQAILFVTQHEGRLSKRRRDRDPFPNLTDTEIAALKEIVSTAFTDWIQPASRTAPELTTPGHPKRIALHQCRRLHRVAFDRADGRMEPA